VHEILLGHGEVWRREQRIDHHSEDVVQHCWDYACHQRAREFQRWVCVTFDYVYLEVLIYHEVIPKDFEGVLTTGRIEL